MSGRMVPADGRAPRAVHGGRDRLADAQRALGDAAAVEVRVALDGDLLHPHLPGGADQDAMISDLPALLGVEGRVVEDDGDLPPLGGLLYRLVLADEGQRTRASAASRS